MKIIFIFNGEEVQLIETGRERGIGPDCGVHYSIADKKHTSSLDSSEYASHEDPSKPLMARPIITEDLLEVRDEIIKPLGYAETVKRTVYDARDGLSLAIFNENNPDHVIDLTWSSRYMLYKRNYSAVKDRYYYQYYEQGWCDLICDIGSLREPFMFKVACDGDKIVGLKISYGALAAINNLLKVEVAK